MTEETRESGEFIIKQGDEGDFFYVLREGEVAIFIDDARVTTCQPGRYDFDIDLFESKSKLVKCVWRLGDDVQLSKNRLCGKHNAD